MNAAPPLVQMTGIAKSYPGVRALDGVDFTLEAGEVHVLFGENGAGKSTLISILAGVTGPTEGTIRINGEEKSFQSVKEARAAGIGAVFQEFSLVPTMSVAQNIFLGQEPRRMGLVDRSRIFTEARKLFAELDFPIDVRRSVISLSRAEQQMVEIAKALHQKARILILDEPTASLTERETEKLFQFIAAAKREGVGIVYISHRIQEFKSIANRITVLRDGRLIGTIPAANLSETALVEMMTGRKMDEIYPAIARAPSPQTVMAIRGLRAWGVDGVDIDARRGEVLGVAGLVGSGKSRTFRTAMGLQAVLGGSVSVHGRDLTGVPTRSMMEAGVFFLPSDRKEEGLMLSATTRDNLALSVIDRADTRNALGLISPGAIRDKTSDIGSQVDLTEAFLARTTSKLSGGNQQKILFGKSFGRDYDIYIFDEPSVGVDVGTRAALYRIIKSIAESGKAVVVISSDLPEVMHLAHRLIAFRNGRISGQFEGDAIQEQAVLAAFFDQERQTA
ncbi:MAG: sugar ABC transporter ATP-binding protein [Stutzerimonas stutzeri]|nr:MAG: sugar ABC transporter ATP-binding protein [Stutzerimonas stutzeri]